MKTFLGIIIAAGVVAVPILVLAFAPAPDAGGKSIEYKTYNGYAESRESGLHGADSFLALAGWAEFSHVFQPVITPRGIPDPIAKSAFDANLFVGVIKRDDVLWDFKIDKVTANGDTLTVSYRTTSHKVEPLPRRDTVKFGGGTFKATAKAYFGGTPKYETAAKRDTPKETAKQIETKKDVETKKETAKQGETKKYADTKKEGTGKTYETEKRTYETGKAPLPHGQSPGSSNFDSALILSVPKEKYTTVIFIENGRKVGSARVGN